MTSRAEPVVFYAQGRPIAGLYHGCAGAPRGTGVVLCNPFGYEAIAAYRGYRELAGRLSAEGFAVLRFDYDGTGDSFGDDLEPGRVAAWKASVSAALDFVRARSGAKALSLVGTRLGALLASAVAAERGDVGSLVLWAPTASGRALVREVRAFSLLKQGGQGGPAQGVPDGEEAAGFVLSAATIQELSQLDLLKLPRAPAPRTLLVPRDDLPSGEEKVAESLRARGSDVALQAVAGYSFLLLDTHESPIPAAFNDAVATWLAQVHAPQPFAAAQPPESKSLSGPGFTEEPISFGPEGRLCGVITRPTGRRPGPLGVIFLNVGSIHRIGPNRMYVRMARRWAAEGIASLRFDLSGLGESQPRAGQPENVLYREDAPDDVRAAMTALHERAGAERFLLAGLCSGAYVAYHSAQADARVAAQVLINPQTYRWRAEDGLKIQTRASFRSSRFYNRAALRTETWKRLLRGEILVGAILRTLMSRNWAAVKKRLLELVGRDATEVAHKLRQLSDRGTFSYFIFGADDGGIDALEEHLGTNARALRDRANVRHHVVDGADHTFSPMWAQLDLEKRLTEILQEVDAAVR
jgi:pimeloyl-ACP methyl ester carboxylesterase